MNLQRCPGKYEQQHSEFGKVINRECIGCLRRTATGEPIKVPEFEVGCPKRIGEQECT